MIIQFTSKYIYRSVEHLQSTSITAYSPPKPPSPSSSPPPLAYRSLWAEAPVHCDHSVGKSRPALALSWLVGLLERSDPPRGRPAAGICLRDIVTVNEGSNRYIRSNHVPCICPIISSLSSRSVPARSSSFPPRESRNFRLRPINQFSQNGFVAERSVRHTQGREASLGWLSSYISDGTEARADVLFRMVRERVLRDLVSMVLLRGTECEGGSMETHCHSIPDASDGNRVGRVERYFSILWRASMADPAGS